MAAMIDYLTGCIDLPRPLPRPIHGGQFVRVDETGAVEVATARRKRILGSFEAAVNIRAPGIHQLEFSGNPAKFLQGHNLYGPTDPAQLLWDALRRIEASGGLPCSLASLGLFSGESVANCTNLSRVDCTVMLLGQSWLDVHTALSSLRVAGRLRDRGKSGLPHTWESKGSNCSGGVTFGARPGASARHRSITFYSKGEDVKVHPLPDPMRGDDEVNYWVARALRCEVRLGGNYLRKRGLRCLSQWTATTALEQWNEMMARMDMNGSDEQPAALALLSDGPRLAYGAWLAGEDLQAVLPRRKFYRYRRAILEAVSVDISIPRPTEPTAQIVPIRRIIELEPAGRPSWADRIERALSEAA